MKKIFFLFFLLLCGGVAFSQAYNNEWIDYSKTYYKFKIATTGLYRINTTALNTVGLGSQPAETFQLWRNGKQVPLFTTVAAGPLGASGYIEFWGEQNDGTLDKDLYRNPADQFSDKLSLQTDSSAYFLTTGSGANLRFSNNANIIAGNTLAPEPYFIHQLRMNFRDQIHRGRALVAGGEYIYSSTYDKGEFFSSLDITPTMPGNGPECLPTSGTPISVGFSNLFVAASGPQPTFRAGVAGSAPNIRNCKIELNNTSIVEDVVQVFDAIILNNPAVNPSLIASNSAVFKISTLPSYQNKCMAATDRLVCSFLELNYARQFNFGGLAQFAFSLPASNTKKYLEINNFNTGNVAPVLYDLTNNRRYVADVSGTGVIRILLEASLSATNLVLVSTAPTNVSQPPAFQPRTFINYSATGNQGDYMIISHSSLQVPFAGKNQVDEYRAYRSSAAGGSFNAKVYDIDQLVDQFAFGVKKHPLSIKNFLRYARGSFSPAPKFAMLIGHGLTYADYRIYENYAQAEKLNVIPTFGYPASDVMLAANGLDPIMSTLIGRLSAVTPQEISIYLDKVKAYEQAQATSTQTIDSKSWMKTVVHVAGANDPNLDVRLTSYLRFYQNVIEDTLFGGTVTNFNKTTTGPITPIVNSLMAQTFQKGISLLNYYGHSSSTSLDYNLDDPSAYNNTGKYPMFVVNGCNAGNLYAFDTSRFFTLNTLSEKYVLAPSKGSIGFIASTHFGLENYLDYYNRGLYRSIGVTGYGKSVSANINEAIISLLQLVGVNDFAGRLHAEETTLHGDPAIRINSFPFADYIVEEPQIKINPTIVSVADNSFNVKAYVYNVGKATGDSVTVEIKRQYPDGSNAIILTKRIKAVRFIDSVSVDVPIIAVRDKGENKIIVTIDSDNRFTEISETNNSATKIINIFEDELRPVYPYNFAIINKATVKLAASTANPLVSSRQYVMEMDTTELFNSSSKITKNLTSVGGLLEFDPGVTLTDSTVYYWRVSPVLATGNRWNSASFVYLNGSSLGYNQSHYFQHTKSTGNRIYIDGASRKWKFSPKPNNLFITNAIYLTDGYKDDLDVAVSVNGSTYIKSACDGPVLQFNIFDPITFKPWRNATVNGVGLSGSGPSDCDVTRNFNFEFLVGNATQRQKAMRFMDSIPNGFIVVVRNNISNNPAINSYAADWKADVSVFGANNSLYHKLVGQGFNVLDSFYKPRAFAFVYKKNDASFAPQSKIADATGDRITLSVDVNTIDTFGVITSPTFGPAVAWKQLKWRGSSEEATNVDRVFVTVFGITSSGREDSLFHLSLAQQDFNLSTVSATQYPYIRLKMTNQDSINLTPYQLRYWRLLYDPVPEGGLAANIAYKAKDTLEAGEKLDFNIAFKNVSDVSFADSIKVKMFILDKNNNQTTIPIQKRKKLVPGDTTNVSALIDTRALLGNNTLYAEVNPDLEQPEQFRFNNFLYKNFFVKGDNFNPLMDVTFDGVHILNGDIVSSKPKILIRLKDESKFQALDDTALTQVFVRYPGNNGALKRFAFGTDTLRFIPADLASGKNEALVEFTPSFLNDSGDDFYELIVRAKDKSGNAAGNMEYKVRFQVITKAMITNMFNYPNPFTTSTAFVFTLTGSEVPQNIRIQVLTVTGKIVKDITKMELGPLHIGRNITEYKWDGTDQYGQRLANGIYLYRVITNQHGNALEKFNTLDPNSDKVNTDKFFNKGYGKMYLMR